jgi:death-on-curing protein
MPKAGARGEFFHRDFHEMAAAYVFHIVRNHPFVDGNKRVGAMAGVVFLYLNGIDVRAPNEALARMITEVANGGMDKAAVTAFFREHSRGSGRWSGPACFRGVGR